MNKWVKRIIIITWIPSIILIIGVVIFLNTPPEKTPPSETEVMISRRINVYPAWGSIKTYLNGAIRPGMTREEVISVLDQIGPWESTFDNQYNEIGFVFKIADEPEFKEVIYFIDKDTSYQIGIWIIFYEYGVVVSFRERPDPL